MGSSFINWYIEEHVQRTGVAIETQGFSFVTSGRRRESLTGNATLHLYPHFKPLQAMPGVVDYLSTEISTSRQKKFPLVTFVDSPGLVDGDMCYPFDVNESILWLAELCDMVFVFFDPIGQALCKRTLNIVESISSKHPERMRFYLSKADEAGHESDRQRVMMQIVQELCKRPGLNKTGFDMPTIYVPNPNKQVRCVNQIEEVCKDIEKTINQTIAMFLTLMLAMVQESLVVDLLGGDLMELLKFYTSPVRTFWAGVPEDYQLMAAVGLVVMTMGLVVLAKWTSRTTTTLSRKQKRQLLDKQEYVKNVVKNKKKSLYSEYLQQTVSDQDL